MSARCPGPVRARRAAFAAGVLAALSAVATAQDRLSRYVDDAVEALAIDEQRADALRRLENLRALAVPRLRHHIHWQRRGDLDRQQQADLIYVFGRLRRDALPAVDDLRDWLREGDHVVTPQLVDALTWIAPFLDQEQGTALNGDLRTALVGTSGDDRAVLYAMLRLGPKPTTQELKRYLTIGTPYRIAVSRWIVATDRVPERDASLTADLRWLLEREMARRRVSFRRGTDRLAPELAAAICKETNQPFDALTARATLQHLDPGERHRAAVWLADHGRALPLEQRCDLVVRLWDSDPTVVEAAARALASWGTRGAVGLARLREIARSHADEQIGDAAEAAADAIVATFADLPARDAAWLRAADATLAWQQPTPPTEPVGERGRAVLAEVATMAAWHSQRPIERFVELLEQAGPDRAVAGALYGWMREAEPGIVQATLAWLARHPGIARDAAEDRGYEEADVDWLRLSRDWVRDEVRGSALEARAWVRTAAAGPDALRECLEDPDLRLASRATAELLVRAPDELGVARDTLHRLATLADDAELGVALPGERSPRTFRQFRVTGPTRVLAAIALAELGAVPEPRTGLAADVRRYCDTTLAELPGLIATRRADGSLADLVEELEAASRAALYVETRLRWPRAGAAK